jgi:outer membrane biosynthesis protein TonB
VKRSGSSATERKEYIFMRSNILKRIGVSIAALAGIALVGGVLTERAHADEWDKMTLLTLSEPTQVADTYLEPGTYMFKLAADQSNREIVQIFNKDRSHLINTIIAFPAYRVFPTGDTKISYWETPPGSAKAVRTWFYPGDNYGEEFRYPTHLRQIAAVTPLPAIAPAPPITEASVTPPPAPAPVAEELVPEPPAPQVAEQAPAPEPAPVEIAQNTAPETTPQAPVEVAQNVPQDNSQADNAQSLPQTASPYPLFGLGGLLALGLYATLRVVRVGA